MNRPRLNDSLAPDNVLSRMLPGKTYGAYALAAKFHVRTAIIRPVLEQMVERGQLELSSAQPGTVGFRRSKATLEPADAPTIATSVATPLKHVQFNEELKGYSTEIAQRIALCMLARPKS